MSYIEKSVKFGRGFYFTHEQMYPAIRNLMSSSEITEELFKRIHGGLKYMDISNYDIDEIENYFKEVGGVSTFIEYFLWEKFPLLEISSYGIYQSFSSNPSQTDDEFIENYEGNSYEDFEGHIIYMPSTEIEPGDTGIGEFSVQQGTTEEIEQLDSMKKIMNAGSGIKDVFWTVVYVN